MTAESRRRVGRGRGPREGPLSLYPPRPLPARPLMRGHREALRPRGWAAGGRVGGGHTGGTREGRKEWERGSTSSHRRGPGWALPLLQKQSQAKPVRLLPPPRFPARVHSVLGTTRPHRGPTRGDLHSPSKELPLEAALQGPPTRRPQLSAPCSVSPCSGTAGTAELAPLSFRNAAGHSMCPWWAPPALRRGGQRRG